MPVTAGGEDDGGDMTADKIAAMIDVSAVRADSTLEEVGEAMELAVRYGCAAVFVLPAHAQGVAERLRGGAVAAGGVAGFPSGGDTTATKAETAAALVKLGCSEIDMVNNIAWLKAGRRADYIRDVHAVVEAAGGSPVKVILECHWLTADEIRRACEWCVEAGAAWVKTGTGWAPTGATPENVGLMKATVGDRCGVKAAGGVRELSTLMELHARGARRFGISVRGVREIFAALDRMGGRTAAP